MSNQEAHLLDQIAYLKSCGQKRGVRVLEKALAKYRDPNWAGNIPLDPNWAGPLRVAL
jgi:hypothetical protein